MYQRSQVPVPVPGVAEHVGSSRTGRDRVEQSRANRGAYRRFTVSVPREKGIRRGLQRELVKLFLKLVKLRPKSAAILNVAKVEKVANC
jgi:hypothetical protein